MRHFLLLLALAENAAARRDLVRSGVVAGPDILAAGLFVTPDLGEALLADPSLGPLIEGVRTPAQLRQLVRVNLDHGVDVIKTRGTEPAGLPNTDPRQQTYTEAELRAVVEETATRGVPVLAHAHGDEGAYAAVAAGVRSIEYGTYLSDSTLALRVRMGTYLVPTYIRAAELFRIEMHTGATGVGLEADLIAMEGNPLEDIRAVQDVLLVISNGRVVLDHLSLARR